MTNRSFTISIDATDRHVCETCNKEFNGRNNQRYCSRRCQHNGDRKSHKMEFIGVDGEGINLNTGEHRYIMLSVGDETLWANGRELTHLDIFPFLYEQFENHRKSAFVGFYLGYDFAHWLKSISEHEAASLIRYVSLRARKSSPVPFPVYINGKDYHCEWELDALGLRRLKLRPHIHAGKNGVCGCGTHGDNLPDKNSLPWMYICDTGPFFQTSFLNVINPAVWPDHKPCTEDEYQTIYEGKSSRDAIVMEGDTSYVKDMVFYNTMENRILARAMSILNDGFLAAGVKLGKSSFYGPGQAIQSYLNTLSRNGRFLQHSDIEDVTPIGVLNNWRASYYGGRFEIFYHGIIPGPSFEYDIQSAYPHAMRNLPCLCSGTWKEVTAKELKDDDPLALVHIDLVASQPYVGPLPFRNPKGNILFPPNVKGWYRWKEVAAAKRAGLIGTVLFIDKAITLVNRCNHESPLISLARLFEQRLAVGKESPHGKAIKLMLNSAYGKFAQSVGSPKYANPIYASMITSECRCMILDAIGTHPNGINDVIMVATDGIYFKSQHPDMPADERHNVKRLGLWETGVKQNITLMKPGVYWDDKARVAISEGKQAKIKSRGISPRALQNNLLRIDDEFREVINGGDMPKLDISVPFAITSPSLALSRGKWSTCGKVVYDDVRHESASIEPKRCNMTITSERLIRSESMRVPPHTESTPYEKTFGFIYGETIAPDGDPLTLWISSLDDIRA